MKAISPMHLISSNSLNDFSNFISQVCKSKFHGSRLQLEDERIIEVRLYFGCWHIGGRGKEGGVLRRVGVTEVMIEMYRHVEIVRLN